MPGFHKPLQIREKLAAAKYITRPFLKVTMDEFTACYLQISFFGFNINKVSEHPFKTS
jgi:hypothetical protein